MSKMHINFDYLPAKVANDLLHLKEEDFALIRDDSNRSTTRRNIRLYYKNFEIFFCGAEYSAYPKRLHSSMHVKKIPKGDTLSIIINRLNTETFSQLFHA